MKTRYVTTSLFIALVVASFAGGTSFALKPPVPSASGKRSPSVLSSSVLSPQDTADPWIVYRNGFYYFAFTAGNRIEIWKSPTIATLTTRPVKKVIWTKPDTGPQSEDIWAPEIHFLRDKWYVYYTASDKTDAARRQYVLEAQTGDAQGAYTERGQIVVPETDVYAIDGTAFEQKGALFFAWSGRDGNENGPQNIFIAPMQNPWTLSGRRVKISTPTNDWEKVGWWVNEGPAVLTRGGRTFLIFSASGGTKPEYSLGMLTNTSGDLLNPAAWRKSPVPVFSLYSGADGAVYGPGHNGSFTSPDGRESWIVYHGKETTADGWGGRLARAQAFTFDPVTGVPRFGHPVPGGVPITAPRNDGDANPVSQTGSRPRFGVRATYRIPGDLATTVRRETTIDFDGRSGIAPPAVSRPGTTAVFEARLQPRYTGTTTLQAWAQGRVVRVFLDGRRIIVADNPTVATSQEAVVTLRKGVVYNLRVEYAVSDNAAVLPALQLAWRGGASLPFEVIPTDCLLPP